MSEDKNLIGIKEIAKLAKVSIGTVDRVLHDRPGVAAKTKERVLDVLKKHPYQPNIIGRILSRKKTINIAALIPKCSPESAYWDAPLAGLIKAQEELYNYQVKLAFLLFDQNDRSTFVQLAEQVKASEFDGVILAPTFLNESLSLTSYCDEKGILYTLLNSELEGSNHLTYFGPNLFKSGSVAAQLATLILNKKDEFLILHISKEMELNHHLLIKERGFKSFLKENRVTNKLHELIIRDTEYQKIENELDRFFSHIRPRVLFVTNSRVSSVAKYLEANDLNDICLIGFDYLPENIAFMKKGVIDFLICHKPIEQGYKSLLALFDKIVKNKIPPQTNYMPIDIICKENYEYYEN